MVAGEMSERKEPVVIGDIRDRRGGRIGQREPASCGMKAVKLQETQWRHIVRSIGVANADGIGQGTAPSRRYWSPRLGMRMIRQRVSDIAPRVGCVAPRCA